MRKLLRFLKDYKKESILSPLFKLLEASFELFVPLVMAAIIDTGIGNKDGGFILKMCGILISLALVGLTCSITAQYFAAKAAVGFATKVRHALFDHIQKLSYTEMDTAGTDTIRLIGYRKRRTSRRFVWIFNCGADGGNRTRGFSLEG